MGQISVRGRLSHLAITSDGKTLLASDPAASVVHLFDAAARKPLGTLPAGKGAGPLAIQVSGSKAFVSNTEEDKITLLDTTTRQVLSHIELGMRPGLLLLKPDGGELFVLCPQASTLAIVDASTTTSRRLFLRAAIRRPAFFGATPACSISPTAAMVR